MLTRLRPRLATLLAALFSFLAEALNRVAEDDRADSQPDPESADMADLRRALNAEIERQDREGRQ